MPTLLFSIVVSVVFTMFALSFFPPLRQMLASIDTTGMSYFLKAMITLMPYAVMFAIVYAITLIFKSKRQG